LAEVAPRPPFDVSAVVRVDAAATIELRSLGVVVDAGTTSGKGGVALKVSGAVLSKYELWIIPTGASATVKAAELAAS
jgi:hypothetical protein